MVKCRTPTHFAPANKLTFHNGLQRSRPTRLTALRVPFPNAVKIPLFLVFVANRGEALLVGTPLATQQRGTLVVAPLIAPAWTVAPGPRKRSTELSSMQFIIPQSLSIASRFVLLMVTMFSSAALGFSNASAAPAEVDKPVESKAASAMYVWNLHDDALPLINLPRHLDGNIDLSLTYSLGQFQMPLFQSLSFNPNTDNYILMVMIGSTTQAEFVVLDRVGASDQFQARGGFNLYLIDKGDSKLLSASDGVTYTFARFANGELHCSRIEDEKGAVISLAYTQTADIQKITDDAGRKINFNYTHQYLSSVTQVWGTGKSRIRQTWAIAERPGVGRNAEAVPLHRREIAKLVPTNAVKPGYTDEMAASDTLLAGIFGGQGAIVAANSYEPRRLAPQYPLYRGDQVADDGSVLRGHLSYAMHLYGSDDGICDMQVYVPAGFTSHSDTPTPTDAAISFYYPRLGQLSDVTLVVFHIADFELKDEGERVRIGRIGGRGGSNNAYKHAHLEFYKGDTGLPNAAARVGLRIDPSSVFTQSLQTALNVQ